MSGEPPRTGLLPTTGTIPHTPPMMRFTTSADGMSIAVRICGLCDSGELLVSATICDLARASAGATFADRGGQALKGIEDAVRVYAVNCE